MKKYYKLRESLKVTSYSDFINKIKGKNTKAVSYPESHFQSREHTIKRQPDHATHTKSAQKTVKCLTEVTANCQGEDPHDRLIDCFNKQSEVLTNNQSVEAFRSVERFTDSKGQFHNDKQNTFVQSRSCSRKKDSSRYQYNRSCESKVSESQISKNDEGVAHFLLSEIKMIIEELTKFNRERITYMDFLEVLRELNMIQSNFEPQRNDVVSKLWAIVTAGSKENTTCLINFAIIILAVMKISLRIKSVKEFFQDIAYSVQPFRTGIANFKKGLPGHQKQYRKNKDGYFDLSQEQVLSIYRKFKELRVTRIFLGRINRKAEKTEEHNQKSTSYTFHPQITEKSRSLAKLKKEKQHFHSVNHDIVEFQIQTEKEIKEMEECTFQPTTQRNRPIDSNAGIKRCEILYKMGKMSRSKQRRERRQDQVEFERNPKVYTFQPEISHSNRSAQKKKPVMGDAKQIDRIIKARVEREVKQKASDKGIPYNQKSIERIRRQVSTKYLRELQSNKTNKELTHQFNKKKGSAISSNKKKQQLPTHTQSQQYSSLIAQSSNQSERQFQEPKQIPRREIFTFEVYLQEDTCFDRITLYEGDNPNVVAQEFIFKHNLKKELETKLARTLQNQFQKLATGTDELNLGEIEQESVEYSLQIRE